MCVTTEEGARTTTDVLHTQDMFTCVYLRKQLLGRELGPVQMYTGDVHMWHTGIYIPLCFWAMVSARARLLPPAEWATASTNSFQDGSPKRVVLYTLFSHSVRTSSR